VGAAVTDIAGSSEWYERGFVCYSNAAKQEMLGVQAVTLEREGAVSEATVREMVAGALAASRAQVALAVSGIAGPAGGTPEKPVGTVCLAWGRRGEPPRSETRRYHGDRDAVRKQAVARALDGLLGLLRR
jgi:nicotinamide-nucleotide amidase